MIVSKWFQVLFHSAPAVLFIFPSWYWFTIGHIGVFSLTGWSRLLPSGFHVPRRTQDSSRTLRNFVYRVCTFSDWAFNLIRLSLRCCFFWSYYPSSRLVWALPISLATTFGITFVFFSSRYWDVSIPWVFFSQPMYSVVDSHAFPHDWVSPFGYPRIVVCVRLPEAFRRFLRPSSALYAKTSTVRSASFNHFLLENC